MRGTLVVVGAGAEDPLKAEGGDAAAPASSEGPGGGISALVLATGVVGAFLGGFGVASFRRRPPDAGTA
jgi:hypothetical protein